MTTNSSKYKSTGSINLLQFVRPSKKMSFKVRRWFYQFPNEDKEELYKNGKYWYYSHPNGGQIGSSSLRNAKGDLLYSGAKVWSELQD